MTRYRSSPTCSKCWQTGHTKRSCPTQKKKVAEWLETNKHLEGTDEYPSKPYWVNEVEQYANSAKNRVCSWCSENGHNTRTCPDKKKVLEKNLAKNKEWRQQVLDKMQEVGLGVGALITNKSRHENSQKLYLVMDMKWDGINLTASGNECVEYYEYHKHNYKRGSSYPEMAVSAIDSNGSHTLYYPQFKDDDDKELFYSASDRLMVVSPSEPSPPNDWINDESWAKGLF